MTQQIEPDPLDEIDKRSKADPAGALVHACGVMQTAANADDHEKRRGYAQTAAYIAARVHHHHGLLDEALMDVVAHIEEVTVRGGVISLRDVQTLWSRIEKNRRRLVVVSNEEGMARARLRGPDDLPAEE